MREQVTQFAGNWIETRPKWTPEEGSKATAEELSKMKKWLKAFAKSRKDQSEDGPEKIKTKEVKQHYCEFCQQEEQRGAVCIDGNKFFNLWQRTIAGLPIPEKFKPRLQSKEERTGGTSRLDMPGKWVELEHWIAGNMDN